MDARLLRFAEVLFRGDAAAIATAREALEQPAAFIARHADALGYFRPEPGWSPDLWPLLLDVAQLVGWVWDVDWRAPSDEVIAAVRELVPARPIVTNWDGLASTHAEADTRTFLRILARAVAPAGEVLVSLDRGSDSYPLALLPAGSLAKAARLAAVIGDRVDTLDAE